MGIETKDQGPTQLEKDFCDSIKRHQAAPGSQDGYIHGVSQIGEVLCACLGP